MSDHEQGLYGKFRVARVDGRPVEWAFVLENTDPFTPEALLAYARACENDYPALAYDLRRIAYEIHGAIDRGES